MAYKKLKSAFKTQIHKRVVNNLNYNYEIIETFHHLLYTVSETMKKCFGTSFLIFEHFIGQKMSTKS